MLSFLVSATEHHNELIVPAPFFGVAALVVLGLLAFVVFSYRDVNHRREVGSHDAHASSHEAVEAPVKKDAKAKK